MENEEKQEIGDFYDNALDFEADLEDATANAVSEDEVEFITKLTEAFEKDGLGAEFSATDNDYFLALVGS